MSNSTELAETIRLISSAQGALLGYVMSLCPDRSAAEDIVQETNVVLWEKAGQFRAGTSFKAWAFRIAYLQTLAHLKRQKRERQVGFSTDLVEQLSRQAEPLLDDFEEKRSALRKCMEGLGKRDYEILHNHYVGQVPLGELGESVGRTAGALKQVLFRLRRSLRKCVELRLSGGIESA